MTNAPVVSSSSALIGLERIGKLQLLRSLFETILIPPAVANEVAPDLPLPDWIREHPLSQPIGPRILHASLGPGESEAISLAIEAGARWVILDERAARRLAEALGLPVIGTLRILVEAKRRGFEPAVKPRVDALIDADFRVAPGLCQLVLADAGEDVP